MATVPCKRCGRLIGWVLTDKGRRLPIDPEPDDTGNVICYYEAGVLRGTVVGGRLHRIESDRPSGVAFMPHFATCPALAKRTRRDAAREVEPRKPKPEPAASLFDN